MKEQEEFKRGTEHSSSVIYENVQQLAAISEDGAECARLERRESTGQDSNAGDQRSCPDKDETDNASFPLGGVRGTPTYSSGTSLSSFTSSSSWSYRVKDAVHRKISSGDDSVSGAGDDLHADKYVSRQLLYAFVLIAQFYLIKAGKKVVYPRRGG